MTQKQRELATIADRLLGDAARSQRTMSAKRNTMEAQARRNRRRVKKMLDERQLTDADVRKIIAMVESR